MLWNALHRSCYSIHFPSTPSLRAYAGLLKKNKKYNFAAVCTLRFITTLDFGFRNCCANGTMRKRLIFSKRFSLELDMSNVRLFVFGRKSLYWSPTVNGRMKPHFSAFRKVMEDIPHQRSWFLSRLENCEPAGCTCKTVTVRTGPQKKSLEMLVKMFVFDWNEHSYWCAVLYVVYRWRLVCFCRSKSSEAYCMLRRIEMRQSQSWRIFCVVYFLSDYNERMFSVIKALYSSTIF